MIIMYGIIYVIPKDVLPMDAKDISKQVDVWAQDWTQKNKETEDKEET